MALAIIENGEISDAAAYGFSAFEPRQRALINTVYQAGSVSKPVAACGVMRLVEQGEIDLDEPINRYLTSWKITSLACDTEEVSVRRVLSHSAGLSTSSFS